jgi:hypothetical protein
MIRLGFRNATRKIKFDSEYSEFVMIEAKQSGDA